MRRIAPGWPLCLLLAWTLVAACSGEAPSPGGQPEATDALYRALGGPDRQALRISAMDTHHGQHVLLAYQKTSSGQATSVLEQSLEALAREVKDSPEFDGVGVIVYSAENGILGRALALRPDIEAWLAGRISDEQFRSRTVLK